MTKRAECCETCRFFEQPRSDDSLGSCHIRSVNGCTFPARNRNDWCDEHDLVPVEHSQDAAWPEGLESFGPDYFNPIMEQTGFSAKLPHSDAIVKDAFGKARDTRQDRVGMVKRFGRTQRIISEALDDVWFFVYDGDASEGFAGKLPIAAFKEHADAIAFVRLQIKSEKPG